MIWMKIKPYITIAEHFTNLPDPRVERTKQHFSPVDRFISPTRNLEPARVSPSGLKATERTLVLRQFMS